MSDEPAITVSDDPAQERYEARVGDERAGFAQYRARPGLIITSRTSIDCWIGAPSSGGCGPDRALDARFQIHEIRGKGTAEPVRGAAETEDRTSLPEQQYLTKRAARLHARGS